MPYPVFAPDVMFDAGIRRAMPKSHTLNATYEYRMGVSIRNLMLVSFVLISRKQLLLQDEVTQEVHWTRTLLKLLKRKNPAAFSPGQPRGLRSRHVPVRMNRIRLRSIVQSDGMFRCDPARGRDGTHERRSMTCHILLQCAHNAGTGAGIVSAKKEKKRRGMNCTTDCSVRCIKRTCPTTNKQKLLCMTFPHIVFSLHILYVTYTPPPYYIFIHN